jgi:hypothetical protein
MKTEKSRNWYQLVRMDKLSARHVSSGCLKGRALAHFFEVRYPLPTQFFPPGDR